MIGQSLGRRAPIQAAATASEAMAEVRAAAPLGLLPFVTKRPYWKVRTGPRCVHALSLPSATTMWTVGAGALA